MPTRPAAVLLPQEGLQGALEYYCIDWPMMAMAVTYALIRRYRLKIGSFCPLSSRKSHEPTIDSNPLGGHFSGMGRPREMARDNGYDDMIAFVRHVIEEVTRTDEDGPEI